jgi:hypothetical protein
MANIYVLLESSLADGGPFRDAIEDNSGRLIAYLPPLAVVDGDDTTSDALRQLIGGDVRAVGVEDVTDLFAAAFGDFELTRMVGVLALTTAPAVDAAEAVRPQQDVEWSGFTCLTSEE